MLAACLLCRGSSGSRERMLFCLFVCFRRFPASSHFFVSQVFEVGDVDRALGEWREFISTEKAFCISSFKIPEYFSITLLFLVFFFMSFCGGDWSPLYLIISFQVDPSFDSRKHFRKMISLGIFETWNSMSCSAQVLVW